MHVQYKFFGKDIVQILVQIFTKLGVDETDFLNLWCRRTCGNIVEAQTTASGCDLQRPPAARVFSTSAYYFFKTGRRACCPNQLPKRLVEQKTSSAVSTAAEASMNNSQGSTSRASPVGESLNSAEQAMGFSSLLLARRACIGTICCDSRREGWYF